MWRFAFFAFFGVLVLECPAWAATKVALVIGGGAYAHAPPLENPVNDAKAMTRLLADAGFEVTSVYDGTQDAIVSALRAFGNASDKAEVAIVFFSGHGIEINGENYLIPVDARLTSDRDVRFETIAMGDILRTIEGATKLKLVLLDACRDNPFAEQMRKSVSTRSISKGLAGIEAMRAPPNTLIAYATAPGQLAEDGTGNNSPFTTALLKELTVPGVDIRIALGGVRDEVVSATRGRQVPYQSGSIGREQVFVGPPLATRPEPPPLTAPPPQPAVSMDPEAAARADFAFAQSINTEAAWDVIIGKYPDSSYAALARAARDKLSQSRIASLAPVEQPKEPESTPLKTGGPPETECDRLAASPNDVLKIPTVAGVELDKISPVPAIVACRSALELYHGEIRFQFQLARALDANKETPEARQLYRQAADKGHLEAQSVVAELNTAGYTSPSDQSAAVQRYRNAADQGDADAMYNLGRLYDDGEDVKQDYRVAMEWYVKAASKDHAGAMFSIALLYDDGRGIPQDYPKAMEWYLKAADKGHLSAMNNIGVLHKNAQGVPQDYRKAMEWYRKAADQGHLNAMTNIGLLYENGLGVRQDYQTAIEWYNKAAAKAFPRALTNIAFLYENGTGVRKDEKKAMKLYKEAADQEYPRAMNNIGFMYEKGRGVSQDYQEAMKWYARAAEKGDDAAMYNMGVLYENGRGTARNYQLAFDWYHKAAEKGHVDAMNNLAWFYDSGSGVSADADSAADWLFKALTAGGDFSRKQMDNNSTAWSRDFRMALQKRLRDKEVYGGKIDGNFGPETKYAIERIFGIEDRG